MSRARILPSVTRAAALLTLSAVALAVWSPPALAESSTAHPKALDAVEVIPGLTQGVSEAAEGVVARLDAPVVSVKSRHGDGEVTMSRQVDNTLGESTGFDGAIVYEGTDSNTDTVVQTLDNGARILEVIYDSEAPTYFTYDFDLPAGADLVPQDDGTVVVGYTRQNGETVTVDVIGIIAAPWAVDASGASLPATYDVDVVSDTVTMSVGVTADTAFPVVADPTYSAGGFQISWSVLRPNLVTVKLDKARSADYWDGNAGVCVGIAFVPVVGPAISAICFAGNILGRATYRYGYCVQFVFDILRASTPSTAITTSVYRGGYCT